MARPKRQRNLASPRMRQPSAEIVDAAFPGNVGALWERKRHLCQSIQTWRAENAFKINALVRRFGWGTWILSKEKYRFSVPHSNTM
jgi:hypothetical protein